MYNQDKSFTFDMLGIKDEPKYPLKLLEKLNEEQLQQYQKTKIEYLIELWVISYKNMGETQKLRYANLKKNILQSMYSTYIITLKLQKAVSLLYYELFFQWHDMTSYIRIGIQNSQLDELKLLWKFSFNLLSISQPIRQQMFGAHLSKNFEQCLRKYIFKSHQEKIFLLQIIKRINHRNQYKQFITNGKFWVKVMDKILSSKCESLLKKKQLNISVYNMQKKIKRQQKTELLQEDQTMSRYDSCSSISSNHSHKSQFLQINPFLLVQNKEEEKLGYQIQLKYQIIQNRNLLEIVNQQYWVSITNKFLEDFKDTICEFDIRKNIYIIKIKTFEKILGSQISIQILKKKFIEDIVNNIGKNLKQKYSPFKKQRWLKVVTKLYEIAYEDKGGLDKATEQRIDQILNKSKIGENDQIAQNLLVVSCKYSLGINSKYLKKLFEFITDSTFKIKIPIQNYLTLGKAFLHGFEFKKFKQVNLYLFCIECTKIIEHFQKSNEQPIKLKQLRKISVKIIYKLLKVLPLDYESEQIIIQAIFQALEKIQLNQKEFDLDMLELIFLILNSKSRTVKNMNWSKYIQIIGAQSIKLNYSPYKRYTYAFLNCILKAGCEYSVENSYKMLQGMSPECFKKQRKIFKNQSQVLLFQLNKKKIKNQNPILEQKTKKAYNKKKKSEKFLINQLSVEEQQKILILQDKKKLNQAFNFYFSEKQKAYFRSMVIMRINSAAIYSYEEQFELILFQFLTIKYLLVVQSIYENHNWEDQHFSLFLKELDSDLLKLFQSLYSLGQYRDIFSLASKLFYLSRNYYFVFSLSSFKFIKQKCFTILSVHFNRTQILSATSFFCSLLIPYRVSSKLKEVYEALNEEDFLIDLFKGINQFIAQQQNFYPQVVVILLSYWIIKPFLQGKQNLKAYFDYVQKNLIWWSEAGYCVNPYFGSESQKQQSNKYILQEFRAETKKLYQKYYSELIRSSIQKKWVPSTIDNLHEILIFYDISVFKNVQDVI